MPVPEISSLSCLLLRRALAQVDTALEHDDRLLQAESEARAPRHQQALRAAVKAFDRMRGRERCIDPDTAVEAWRALASGRWSLIERFESDGRRYLVARCNPPGAVSGQALSRLEAHAMVLRAQGASYKLAAYELDISPATAHRLVQAGMRKLGMNLESELPLLIHAWDNVSNVRIAQLTLDDDRFVLVSYPLPRWQLPDELTRAEREVVQAVLEGASRSEVAQRRGTSSRTIANLLANAFRKLGVQSKMELAAKLASAGGATLPEASQRKTTMD